jgi:hypothetical protein
MNMHNRLKYLLAPDSAAGLPIGAIPDGPSSDPAAPDTEFDSEAGVDTTAAAADTTTASQSTTGHAAAPTGAAAAVPTGQSPAYGGPDSEEDEGKDGNDTTNPAAPNDNAAAINNLNKPAAWDKRDYSKFPAELQPYVRKLPNQLFKQAEAELLPIFEKAKKYESEALPKIAELEKAVAAKPSFAHEHPEGYVLDPEYQQVSLLADRASFEASHWESQLARILSGEGFQDLLGYDKRTGQPVYKEIDAPADGRVDPRWQVEIQRRFNEATMKSGQFVGMRDSFRQNYSSEVQRSAAELVETRKRIFRDMDESKFTETEKGYKQLVLDALPKVHKRNPLATDLAYALIAIKRIEAFYNDALKKQSAASPAAAAKVAKAGPRPAAVGTSAAPADDFVKFSDLDD